MNEEAVKLNPRSLTHLFLTLSRARRKLYEKEKKRNELLGSIEKIRQVSEKTTNKSLILAELQKLESQVSILVENHAEEQDMLRRLQQKYEIQKPKVPVKSFEDFEKISWRLGENVQKLNKVQEEPRIEVIKVEKDKVNELKQIEGLLRIIELKYNRLKSKKQNPADLKRLKEMIDRYKKMIQEIKGSA